MQGFQFLIFVIVGVMFTNATVHVCPQGQVWNECAIGCDRTCADPEPQCTKQCVQRCECPIGTLLHGGGCITKSGCPPGLEEKELPQVQPVQECPDGKLWMECGTKCPRTCEEPKPAFCDLACVSGCFCDSDKVLNVDGQCVELEDCSSQ